MSDDTIERTPQGLVERAQAAVRDAQAIVADHLDAGAERLRTSGAARGIGAGLADQAAARLEATAYGLRAHDFAAALVAIDTEIRQRPWIAMGIALAVGTLVGMALKRQPSARH